MSESNSDDMREAYFSKFEKMGETDVRIRLDHWQDKDRYRFAHATEWLRLKEETRACEAASRRDERENETLEIARNANKIATRAYKLAVAAAILSAVISAVVSVMYGHTH